MCLACCSAVGLQTAAPGPAELHACTWAGKHLITQTRQESELSKARNVQSVCWVMDLNLNQLSNTPHKPVRVKHKTFDQIEHLSIDPLSLSFLLVTRH
jgi:hypothetical protein